MAKVKLQITVDCELEKTLREMWKEERDRISNFNLSFSHWLQDRLKEVVERRKH